MAATTRTELLIREASHKRDLARQLRMEQVHPHELPWMESYARLLESEAAELDRVARTNSP